MTLIIAVSTPRWNAIASDRILCRLDGQAVKSDAVKLVLYFNDMVFGYTGLARLLGKDRRWHDTSEWLLDVLLSVGGRSVPNAVEVVLHEAQESFDRMYRLHPSWPNHPLAFLGIGWERHTSQPSKIEYSTCALVSNFHLATGGRFAPSNPGRLFSGHLERISQPVVSCAAIGYQQTQEEMDWLKERIDPQLLAAKNVDFMKQSIRQTSKRLKHKYVGMDVLAAIIPHDAPLSRHVIVTSLQGDAGFRFTDDPVIPLEFDQHECSYFLRYSPARDQSVYYAPHIVAPGFQAADMWGRNPDRLNSTGFNVWQKTDEKSGKVVAFRNVQIEVEEKKHRKGRKQKKRRK